MIGFMIGLVVGGAVTILCLALALVAVSEDEQQSKRQ